MAIREEGQVLTGALTTTAEKLVTLLDYVEQVVRLDERVAFRLADYRLSDGTSLVVPAAEVVGLPGVTLESRDDEGPIWLSVERLARQPPPVQPDAIAPWLTLPADPGGLPTLITERLQTVTGRERNALLAAEQAVEEDFASAPDRAEHQGTPHFDLTLRLPPQVADQAEAWIDGPWRSWSDQEAIRRRTIALYGRLYKLQQQLELAGAESALEAVWGIGPVLWQHESRSLERPLIERMVELELEPGGTIRVRPRATEARVDLKPYEEMGCPNLNLLDDIIRREIARASEDDGVTPYRRETFEPILIAAATRLAPNGAYRPEQAPVPPLTAPGDGLIVSDSWVLFARPRSQHLVRDDIARFRTLARDGAAIHGLAERLVTPPSDDAGGPWQPLADGLGALPEHNGTSEASSITDVFFPKPFNEDQIAIVRHLAGSDGLVVQGPPGTGKTHTIANLICHAMALGQRVLVVSRGEAALSVLREQLPEKVRPLTIAILSSERQGLRQVETAVREIQSVVEESRPEIRLSAIRRCEAEIVKIRARLAAIDAELDGIAEQQTAPIGPQAETPADLARRLAESRQAYAWFTDRPSVFAADTDLDDETLASLADSRQAAGELLDHLDAELPPLITLPEVAQVAAWHDDLRRARLLAGDAGGPAQSLRVGPAQVDDAERCVTVLRALASAWETVLRQPWLEPIMSAAARRDASAWLDLLRDIAADFWAVEAERIRLAPFAIEVPEGLLDDEAARAAVSRAAAGERLWPRLSFGRSLGKDIVAAIRVRGAAPGDEDLWRAVQGHIGLQDRRATLAARWRSFATETGSPAGADPGDPAAASHYLRHLDGAGASLAGVATAARGVPALATLAVDPGLARALAAQIEAAVSATRLAVADAARTQAAALFIGGDRTSLMGRQILGQAVGREDVQPDKLEAIWTALLARLARLAETAPAFHEIRSTTDHIAAAGAPDWAQHLRREAPGQGGDALLPTDWRDAWDSGAAEFHLARIEGRDRLLALARERDAADRRASKLFVELVRERAFHALERRLSPRVKSALVEYVRALGRLGKGTGKGAGRHRGAARDAMGRCYDAIPCWIMPTWRVAEQLPSDLAAFDLVILDEASQSDVTELPALLRGRKILAVGDDRQVSPTPPFVTQNKIEQLRHHFLRHLPYRSLLEPGESLYDLMRAVFPDTRLMLKEHFRCVEPIIRFSMQFYPEKLVPLRIPSAQERLDPPLIDIFVPHGERDGARKINRAEAQVIVDEIAAIAEGPAQRHRSLGVISLIGNEQAELIRVMLAERIGEEAMQRHALLCGDSATFQGNERDIVFLSMVADRKRRTTLTMLRYEQRFNVAASRARDRLVLVRSVSPEDLNPADLKARLIAHFDNPMPARPALTEDLFAACESEFERDLMRRLLGLGYRVEPQVGAQGFRIDLVVEGAEGRRLAVECDGDAFHGPGQWREDMRRQRILERVGWRFWRCFASSFYREPEAVMADLVDALDKQGIEPLGASDTHPRHQHLTERRIAAAPATAPEDLPAIAEPEPLRAANGKALAEDAGAGIRAGDRVALLFADRKRLTIRLTASGGGDEARGLVSLGTPLGLALAGAEEGDEIDVPQDSGVPAKAMVEAVERAP